ncbi:YciI-like protein [Pseudomonas sp. A014]|uniref:YciI-like protein n=1 Tax=Pseudomonas sp. A014 TaxID=3458058 RepID=UPI00403606D9
MEHYILFMEFNELYLEKRERVRAEHLEKAWKAVERGELVLAGALTNPMDSAIMLFLSDNLETVEKFALDDPYFKNGLVKKWSIRKWQTTVGLSATNPLRNLAP